MLKVSNVKKIMMKLIHLHFFKRLFKFFQISCSLDIFFWPLRRFINLRKKRNYNRSDFAKEFLHLFNYSNFCI